MRVIELHAPTNGGSLYFGRANSCRGRRYEFLASTNGNPGPRVFRARRRRAA